MLCSVYGLLSKLVQNQIHFFAPDININTLLWVTYGWLKAPGTWELLSRNIWLASNGINIFSGCCESRSPGLWVSGDVVDRKLWVEGSRGLCRKPGSHYWAYCPFHAFHITLHRQRELWKLMFSWLIGWSVKNKIWNPLLSPTLSSDVWN